MKSILVLAYERIGIWAKAIAQNKTKIVVCIIENDKLFRMRKKQNVFRINFHLNLYRAIFFLGQNLNDHPFCDNSYVSAAFNRLEKMFFFIILLSIMIFD